MPSLTKKEKKIFAAGCRKGARTSRRTRRKRYY